VGKHESPARGLYDSNEISVCNTGALFSNLEKHFNVLFQVTGNWRG
jgi:hypothetical protein